MKNAIMIGFIAGVAGGLAGTVGSRMFTSPEPTDQNGSYQEVALNPGAEVDNELVGQLADLRRQNDELSMRLAAVEKGFQGASREAVSTDGNIDVAALQDQVTALAAALKNPQSASSAGLRNMVAGALKEVQDADSEQRQIEREQRAVDRIVGQVDNYAEKLGLDAVQKKEMTGILLVANTKRDELFSSMRDGSLPREDIRTAMSDMGAETNASLQNVLNAQQFESYTEMSNDRGRNWGGGGDRGGRGGR